MVVKFGIIGAGGIAQGSCREIAAHSQAEIVAICDAHEERMKELGAAHNARHLFTDSKDLLASDDVDAVYIAVPNALHAPLAEAALEAGKHVVLEKPFALNLKEANAVAEAARRSGRLFMLGMNQRFAAGPQKVKSLVKSGALGDIYHAKACWMRRSGIPRLGTWFVSKKLAGGGSLLDIGVHVMDLAMYLMDNFKPEAVSGATYAQFGTRGIGEGGWGTSDREGMAFDVDDFATAIVKLAGGATLCLDVSWALHQATSNELNVQLFGTEAGASVYPAELYRYGRNGGEYQVIQDPDAAITYAHKSRFHNFINAILGDEEPCVTMEQALAVQAVIDGIYKSCQTGKETRL